MAGAGGRYAGRMSSLPNPLELVGQLVPGRGAPAPAGSTAEGTAEGGEGPGEQPGPRRGHQVLIGGRHGSPQINISLPFSQIEISGDAEAVRDEMAELAGLIGQLAAAVDLMADALPDEIETQEARASVAVVRAAALEVAQRLAAPAAD